MMSLKDSMDLAKRKLADATSRKSKNAEERGKAKGEQAGMSKSLEADRAYLQSLQTECGEKSDEWEERKKTAADETEAILKAKEILASGVKASAFVQAAKQ